MTIAPFQYTTKPRRLSPTDIITATVSYEKLHGNTCPYFSVCGDIMSLQYVRGSRPVKFGGHYHYGHTGGQCVEEIAAAFPELVPYMKWHLAGPDGPMHYVANSVYWHRRWGDSIAGPPWSEDEVVLEHDTDTLRDYFCSTCVFTPGEADLEEIVCWDEQELTQWLEARLPRLQSEFMEAMQQVSELKL